MIVDFAVITTGDHMQTDGFRENVSDAALTDGAVLRLEHGAMPVGRLLRQYRDGDRIHGVFQVSDEWAPEVADRLRETRGRGSVEFRPSAIQHRENGTNHLGMVLVSGVAFSDDPARTDCIVADVRGTLPARNTRRDSGTRSRVPRSSTPLTAQQRERVSHALAERMNPDKMHTCTVPFLQT